MPAMSLFSAVFPGAEKTENDKPASVGLFSAASAFRRTGDEYTRTAETAVKKRGAASGDGKGDSKTAKKMKKAASGAEAPASAQGEKKKKKGKAGGQPEGEGLAGAKARKVGSGKKSKAEADASEEDLEATVVEKPKKGKAKRKAAAEAEPEEASSASSTDQESSDDDDVPDTSGYSSEDSWGNVSDDTDAGPEESRRARPRDMLTGKVLGEEDDDDDGSDASGSEGDRSDDDDDSEKSDDDVSEKGGEGESEEDGDASSGSDEEGDEDAKVASGSGQEEEGKVKEESKKEASKADDPEAEEAKRAAQEEALKRSVFVGNVDLKVKPKELKRFFSQAGKVESVRLRSVPVKLDSKVPRKGKVNTSLYNENRATCNAFVCYKDAADVDNALALNMKVLGGRHLRVDRAVPASKHSEASVVYDPELSVFLGNLPFEVEEEDIITAFNSGDTAPELEGAVRGVRVVRDANTNMCKGIAYVLFGAKSAVKAALSLEGTKIRGREVRVSRVRRQAGDPSKRASARKKENWQGTATKGTKGVKRAPVDVAAEKRKVVAKEKKHAPENRARKTKRPAVRARKAAANKAALAAIAKPTKRHGPKPGAAKRKPKAKAATKGPNARGKKGGK